MGQLWVLRAQGSRLSRRHLHSRSFPCLLPVLGWHLSPQPGGSTTPGDRRAVLQTPRGTRGHRRRFPEPKAMGGFKCGRYFNKNQPFCPGFAMEKGCCWRQRGEDGVCIGVVRSGRSRSGSIPTPMTAPPLTPSSAPPLLALPGGAPPCPEILFQARKLSHCFGEARRLASAQALFPPAAFCPGRAEPPAHKLSSRHRLPGAFSCPTIEPARRLLSR